MSLTFIYGNPGTGKSEILYDKLIGHAKKDPFSRIFLIVPEQFTLETQKKMVRRSEGHVITNIDVVSFERLAFRAFEEIGLRQEVLEDHGKSLLLRKIASDQNDDLTFLRANIKKTGYIDEVKSMLSELMQYAVRPEDLEAVLETLPREGSLYHKLSDILIMYRGMESRFAASMLVAERLPDALALHVPAVPMLQNAVFAFDGFTGFTPVQEKLIDALMRVSSELYVTVTLDESEPAFGQDAGRNIPIEQLFYMSKKMIWKLITLADRNHIAVSQPVLTRQTAKSRFAGKAALRHLERNLFRPQHAAWSGKQDEIHITSCANPKEELEYAAYQIAKMVREDGCRYSDFAIVSANADTYDKYAKGIMHLYQIPCFSDRKKDITYHPLTEALRAVLEIVYSDFSADSVFRLLKTGLLPFSDEEIHMLETYCIARGVRGRRRFETPFRVPTKSMREAAGRAGDAGDEKLANEMLRLNEIRRRFFSCVEPVCRLFASESVSVRGISEALYLFLQEIRAEEALKSMQDALDAEDREDDRAVYEQIWPAVMDLLDKFVSLLGEEHMDAQEYAEILDAGFSAVKIGILPPGSDCVILGDIERTRLDGIRYLFFLGLNDGIVPQHAGQGGMLSQYDRETLAAHGLTLAPTAREEVFLQRFYLYWNLTRPSEGLFLTYARLDADGKAIRPSYLTGLLSGMFPALVTDVFPGEAERLPLTKECGIKSWLSGLDQAASGEMTDGWAALHSWLLSDPDWHDTIERFIEIRFCDAWKETLSAQTAGALYGTVLSNSVSRLERFIRCPYQHFLSYGLQLSEREAFRVLPVDLGTLMHDVLAVFSRKVDAGSDWMQITQDEWETYLNESILEAELGQSESVLYDNATNLYRLDVIRRTISRSIEAMIRQIRAGAFLPAEYEMAFHVRNENLILNGRIDRCDLYAGDDKKWIRIIDYKSGDVRFRLSDFYYGLSMQLALYAEAVAQDFARRGEEILPGGFFYYHLDDPLTDLADLKNGETAEDAAFSAYRLRGMVNSDPDAYRNMDQTFTKKSLIIPVELKKDNSFGARSDVTDTHGFSMLRRHAVSKCLDTGKRILSGQIDPAPYEHRHKSGCDFCSFQGICGFDRRIPGYEKNVFPDLSDSEVWERLEHETEQTWQ